MEFIMTKKASAERGPPGSSSAKKSKAVAEAESAGAAKITVTLDPKLLQCSVCCRAMDIPIFQCDNGHLTCGECSERLDFYCSSCGEPNDTECRSVEHIIGGMTMPCSFRELGCSEMIPITKKLAHEVSCPHAPCYCPNPGCRSYPNQSLLDHITMQHRNLQYTRVTAGKFCPLRMHDEELAHLVSLASAAGVRSSCCWLTGACRRAALCR